LRTVQALLDPNAQAPTGDTITLILNKGNVRLRQRPKSPVERRGHSRWGEGNAPDLPFPQVAASDLDVPIVGQMPTPNFSLGDEFEPGAVQVVGFEAPFRRAGFRKQDLEDAPGNPHDALIFADTYAELDSVPVGVPPGVGRKSEKHRPPAVFR
jgi:hypothetical protein